MTSENIYNKDGTQRSCPHGSSVTYPVGIAHRVKVGDSNCWNCPCFHGSDVTKPMAQAILCCYPNFAPQYEYSNNKT